MTIIEQLEDADKTLSTDGYKEYSYVRIAISEAIKSLNKQDVSNILIDTEEIQPFLYWVFHKADRIWVEQTLGWRKNAIEELYTTYKEITAKKKHEKSRNKTFWG